MWHLWFCVHNNISNNYSHALYRCNSAWGSLANEIEPSVILRFISHARCRSVGVHNLNNYLMVYAEFSLPKTKVFKQLKIICNSKSVSRKRWPMNIFGCVFQDYQEQCLDYLLQWYMYDTCIHYRWLISSCVQSWNSLNEPVLLANIL